MQKTFFDMLYRQVQQIDISTFDVPQLIALSRFYNNICSLAPVMPHVEYDSCSPQGTAKQAKEIARILIAGIEDGMSPVQEMRCLNVLFEYITQYIDQEWEERLLHRAWILSENYSPASSEESDFCQFLCNCYYMAEDKKLANRAKKMINVWCRQQNAVGEWPALKPEAALGRLRAMNAYHTCTLRTNFEIFQQKGISHYLNDFPEHHTEIITEELSLYLEKAELLLLVSSHTAERKRIEKTGTILEQYLKRNSLHAACAGGYPTKENEELFNATEFSETVLQSLSILAFCLLAQDEEDIPNSQKHSQQVSYGHAFTFNVDKVHHQYQI